MREEEGTFGFSQGGDVWVTLLAAWKKHGSDDEDEDGRVVGRLRIAPGGSGEACAALRSAPRTRTDCLQLERRLLLSLRRPPPFCLCRAGLFGQEAPAI